MKRVSIIGSPGSGKSTLARLIAEYADLPIYHLDRLMWRPNWELVDRETQIHIQKEVTAKDEWIIDGNYSATLAIRLDRADVIVFLDFNRFLCIYRVFKRYMTYRNKTRPDMIEGNKERLEWEFIQYIWNFPQTNRPALLTHLGKLDDTKKVYHLRTKKDAQNFINDIRKGTVSQ